MSVFALLGAAVLSAVAALILRESKSGVSSLFALLSGVLLLAAAAGRYAPAVRELLALSSASSFSSYAGVFLRALGVALLAELAASVCRDLGEASLAAKAELIGKAEILLLSLPLVRELLAAVSELLV